LFGHRACRGLIPAKPADKRPKSTEKRPKTLGEKALPAPVV
jgi:hypothetical protein